MQKRSLRFGSVLRKKQKKKGKKEREKKQKQARKSNKRKGRRLVWRWSLLRWRKGGESSASSMIT